MVVWLALCSLIAAGELWSRVAPRELQQVMVVEGLVEDFVPMAPGRQNFESFRVGGVAFRYSDAVNRPGFHQTSAAGGPMREGLPVRLHYVGPADNPTIVKLEIRQ